MLSMPTEDGFPFLAFALQGLFSCKLTLELTNQKPQNKTVSHQSLFLKSDAKQINMCSNFYVIAIKVNYIPIENGSVIEFNREYCFKDHRVKKSWR